MRLLTTLPQVNADFIREWCRAQPLSEVTKSSYVNGRLEKWYGLGSNLMSLRFGKAKVFPADPIPTWLSACGDKHLPGWNSLLVCGGPTSIGWHRDHGHFLGPAVMINLGEATYFEAAQNTDLGKEPNAVAATMFALKDGQVVWIDTKLPHRSEQKSPERFNLTFRTIKTEFLQESF